MAVDYTVIVVYLVGMLAMGWWGMRRAKSKSEFLVAGRRLGPTMYSGTMAAIVLGGASTIGGVGLGYQYGLSGAWMVFTIGLGLLALSVFFSARIARLKVYTVSEMLDLRYGGRAGLISGVVMWAYTLMLAVTSTIAYATIFDVLFDMNRTVAIILGGSIVVAYSTLGGMWSITLTDMVQFVVKTIGVLLLLLPIAVVKAGGFSEMKASLPTEYFDPLGIGGETIFTYVLIYTFGMLIGQDIWQRVFTARSDTTAKWGGTVAGTYCLVYALAGAVIGTAAKVLYPKLASADDAFATIVKDELPVGVRGLVLAAALAAVMSTSSGALIACATVANNDIWSRLRGAVTSGSGIRGRARRGPGQPRLHPHHGHRGHLYGDRAQQRHRGPDRRVQPARRRSPRAHPRRSALEARYRSGRPRRRRGRRPRGDRPDGVLRNPRERTRLLRAPLLPRRLRDRLARHPRDRRGGPRRLARAARGPGLRTRVRPRSGPPVKSEKPHIRDEACEQ
jgi:SSS family solute:Na+ symporter